MHINLIYVKAKVKMRICPHRQASLKIISYLLSFHVKF
jgi:hypothetical protein